MSVAPVRVTVMRKLFRTIEEKTGVHEPGYEPPVEAYVDVPDEETSAGEAGYGTVGIAVSVIGGAMIAVSAFLPLDEPRYALSRVSENTLVQHEGWWLIAMGAVIALAAVASKRRVMAVILLSLIAAAFVVRFGSDKALRTLYPLGANGEAQEGAGGTVVPLGIAIYIAGAGAALAFVGALTMWGSKEIAAPAPEAEPTKRCPDCAETILAAARVCKHCGARLDVDAHTHTV
jgi:hypothetical protein